MFDNVKLKIVTIIGARPQFIKSSVISNCIKNLKLFEEICIHTGQHFDDNMSEIFFSELKIPKPKYRLNINSLNDEKMVHKMVKLLEKILKIESPKGVLLYGDTNTTLAGSLAASKLSIPIFHVESGLRSMNRAMVEEKNRIITDHLSSLLFCPNTNSRENLKNEGIVKGIYIAGDIMYDSFLLHEKLTNKKIKSGSSFILSTIHRQENCRSEKKIKQIISSLNEINKYTRVIMPIHPRTMSTIKKYKIKANFKLIDPLGYLDFISYLKKSSMVITDSGGVQKEAFFAKKEMYYS